MADLIFPGTTLTLLAFIIVREILRSLKENEVHQQIRDLYVWHSKTDEDGVPVWYVRRSLEDTIVKLAENMEKQTELLRVMVENQKQMIKGIYKGEK
jgi:hypothetical protein